MRGIAEIMLRRGSPTEVGQVVTFLCSPKAAFITGVVLPVDGGYICVETYSIKVQKYPSGATKEKLFSPNSFSYTFVTSVASLLLTRW